MTTEPTRRKLSPTEAPWRDRMCGHCGRGGARASAKGVSLCHPDDPKLPDCYRRVTVYHEPVGALLGDGPKPSGVEGIIRMNGAQDPPISDRLASELRDALAAVERGESVDLGSFAKYADGDDEDAKAAADSRMAKAPDGTLKRVSEFSAEDKWWCDGEECGEEGQPPHVHCMMHRHLVDLATGMTVDPEPGPSRD